MEFDPFDPNPWETTSHQSSSPSSPQSHPPDPPLHHPPPQNDPPLPNPPPRRKDPKPKNRNLAVQLVITIKQMMSQHIHQLGSSDGRRDIIRAVWSLFVKDTRRTKQILMLMFNQRIYDQALIKSYGFEQIYGYTHFTEYRKAMEQLKEAIQEVMTPEEVQRNIHTRKIKEANRQEVIEYINAFMRNQLAEGHITSRQHQQTALIVSEILNRTSREENFISAVIATKTRNWGSPHHQSIP